MTLEELDKKLKKIEKKAALDKAYYWKKRLAVFRYLGGMCQCGECDIKNLEIHHEEPLLSSPKTNGFSRDGRSGAARYREWKLIIEGKLKAKICCKTCHAEIEHNGNTNELKKVKHEI